MNFAALLQSTSVSSIITASGLAAEFKSIVPGDLFLSLGLGFVVGAIIAIVYKRTYRGVLYSPSFAITLIMVAIISGTISRPILSLKVLATKYSEGD